MQSLFILCASLLASTAFSIPSNSLTVSPIANCQVLDERNLNFCLQCYDGYRKMYRTDLKKDFCVMAPADSYLMNFFSPSDSNTLMCVVQDSSSGVISAKECSTIGSGDSIADFKAANFGIMGDLLWGQDNDGTQVRFFDASSGGDKNGFSKVCQPTTKHGLACSSDYISRKSTSEIRALVDLSDYSSSSCVFVLTMCQDTNSLKLVPVTSNPDNIITNIEIDVVQKEKDSHSSYY